MAATHPLKDTWKLCSQETVTKEHILKHNGNFEAARKAMPLKQLETVATVEELWSAFNVLPPLMSMPATENLSLFRERMAPEFESYPGGGRFTIQGLPENADKLAERILIAVVGEQVRQGVPEAQDGLCAGIRFARRQKKNEDNVRIEVWLTSSALEKPFQDYFSKILADDGQGGLTIQWESFSASSS